MRSLDRYNIISNNFYLDQCSADRGIGTVDIIDLTSSSYGRSDDPMGVDADSLAKAVSSSEMVNGDVTELLNQGDGSYQNWVNGTSYPVHSAEAVIYKISLSGTYPTSFYIGDGFSAEGMEIIGYMTDGTTKTLSLEDVTFTGYDKNTKGQQTITVDYRGILTQYNVNVLVQNAKSITVYLTIYGDEIHDSDTDGTSHTLSVGNLITWLSRKTITLTENSTVQNALEQAVIGTGLELIADPATQYGWYLRGIIKDGKELSEFTNGKNSGWMYTVNGTHPEIGAGKYYPNDGDVIIWHYTDDYTKEEGSEKWNTVETASSSKDISASVKGDAAVASVSSADLTALIDTAKKDGSAAVQLNITGADKASEITVEMPKASLNDLATRTDAALNVKTALGSVSMDKTVMKSVVSGASADTVKLVLTKISDTETDVKLVSGDKTITDLGAGNITIALPVSSALQGKSLAAAYTDADGSLVKLSGKVVTIDGKQYYQIETAHMGTFTLNEEAAIDAAIAAQNGDMDAEKAARIKAGVENTTIKLWSTFSKKNNIQLDWTKSAGYKVDCYQVYKSTKRYSGYGTKAYYQTTTRTKNFYINTKELKKGTRYFYKVRGVRTISGEKVYTQWSNKAWRISRVNKK